MIRVLVVEDSAVVRELLIRILESDAEIKVVGTVTSGQDALEFMQTSRPDLITMDIHMRHMDGFETTRRIMEQWPTPIVIVSSSPEIGNQVMAFRAIDAGALAILPSPSGIGHALHRQSAQELVRTVKLMSEVKVVRRRPKPNGAAAAVPTSSCRETTLALVAIGASTGGPQALQTIVADFPADFQPAVLAVQHIASGFADGFATWLGQSSRLPVRLAEHGELIIPGHIYIAPDQHHMTAGPGGSIRLTDEEPENGLKPAVSVLFRSVAAFYGRRAAGVLLSGMGKDGAKELKLLRDTGAVTIAQDCESSVVHGMPGEAIRLGGATYVAPPEKIVSILTSLPVRRTSEDSE